MKYEIEEVSLERIKKLRRMGFLAEAMDMRSQYDEWRDRTRNSDKLQHRKAIEHDK